MIGIYAYWVLVAVVYLLHVRIMAYLKKYLPANSTISEGNAIMSAPSAPNSLSPVPTVQPDPVSQAIINNDPVDQIIPTPPTEMTIKLDIESINQLADVMMARQQSQQAAQVQQQAQNEVYNPNPERESEHTDYDKKEMP
ncbi:hypothetical protein UFOVP1_3 [uncultured Caudovirales phage]|uniref:Uncharacterized protein n=1 Tax=uncultured Caudovirales phage TaxID=2100421 RepID=A0A6J5KJ45_9CAUD|nr:hypothetical protein UFOVP1_3 [uncultured Caudovirales phage]